MSETRYGAIADELTEEILRGRYRPGDRLPSERDLAARYGVNRGAVREAIKKLEQLGLASVQPGGARVQPIDEASLDVVGCLLALDDAPDPRLVEQVMTVMRTLMQLAVREAMARGSDQEITDIRNAIAAIGDPKSSPEQRVHARLEVGRRFMKASGNLVLALIGRALRMQMFGGAGRAGQYLHADDDHAEFVAQMDRALASRDADAVIATFNQMVGHSEQQVLTALRTARAASNGHTGISP